MQFSFLQTSASHEPAYEVVDALEAADFAVVDADSRPAVKSVLQPGRVAQAVFVGDEAPTGAMWHLRRPIDPTRILRTLDEPTTRRGTGGEPTRPAALHDLPTLNDIVSLPQAPIEAAAVMMPPPVAAAAPHGAAKVAARAKARRARQASGRSEPAAAEPLRDALVLDADSVANPLLCTLLEGFGFQAHSVETIDDAAAQLDQRAFATVFLAVGLDDGVALLRHIRAKPAPWPHARPAVVLLTARPDPAERDRAALAGLNEPLVKPLGRGDVARALESAGVVLPADARRP